jgi:hypothetical protein
MSTSAISQDCTVAIDRRPAVDVAIEKLARHLLRWSDARAVKQHPSRERRELIRENERVRFAGGSPIGR